MNFNFKNWAKGIALALMALVGFGSAAAQDSEPIITIKTNLYEQLGSANSCTVVIGGFAESDWIDVDCGAGTEEHELVRASYDSESASYTATAITCNVNSEGTIRIYGNAENIQYLDINGCYATEIEMSACTKLQFFLASHNLLKKLDLSGFPDLLTIDVDDNPFNESPLKIGSNHPVLTILEMGQTDNLDQEFNLSDYPLLLSFGAYANKGLRKLDPTGCPDLVRLSIDITNVESLDVSKNTKLRVLNISETGIKEIDLSNNTELVELYCVHQSGSVHKDAKMEHLDISNNTELLNLFASGNNLREIDLSKNIKLQNIYLGDNLLTSIDISNNTDIFNLVIRNNYLTFATLPFPQSTWVDYDYLPRNMEVNMSYKVGDVIDLSDKVLREGTVTTMAVYSVNDQNAVSVVDESCYNYADGKISFNRELSDSVYVAFANDAFPEITLDGMPLRTTKFAVKSEENFGKDIKKVSFKAALLSGGGVDLNFKVGIAGATAENPKTFMVETAEGTLVECTATTSEIPAEANVTGLNSPLGAVAIYVHEGDFITALDIEDLQLTSIDLSQARALNQLRLVNTQLYSIDLGWNRSLHSLVLTGNYFSTLNIRGVNDTYQKTLLQDIDLSNNGLTSVTLNDMYTIHNLNLSNNNLSELSFKDSDMMETLDISNNKFTTVNLSYCTLMTKLNIAHNQIAELVLPEEISLKELHCENNGFNFATLPQIASLEVFTFAPQNEVKISPIGPGADLSLYNTNGITNYVWKFEDGSLLVENSDYTIAAGKTRFDEKNIGKKAYCEMTNATFEGLTLTTTKIEIAGMPEFELASFTTKSDGSATVIMTASVEGSIICIDWKGDGLELDQYVLGTNYQTFTATTHAGCTAKVYSYGEQSHLTVFSLIDAALENADFSKMTELTSLNVKNAGLTSITLPNSADLTELLLDGNALESIDLTQYSKLYCLTLNNNKFASFDLSKYPSLGIFAISQNQLTDITLGNPELWQLDLSNNKLAEVDLSGVPNLNQLTVAHNELSTIDLSMMRDLKVLFVDYNKFRFSTLPENKDYALYTYFGQAEIPVTENEGKIDLSAEAKVGDVETEFRWFFGEPYINEETGALEGEELYLDEEYTIENGVTTFLTNINGVMCTLTNAAFPNVILFTPLINITTSGIEDIQADANKVVYTDGGNVYVVGITGKARIYSTTGALVAQKEAVAGTARFEGLASGIYIVVADGVNQKVAVE
ncbi:MAG: hypothetical protein ACI4UL_07135 [Muribaculaceae bacterium]